MATATRPGTPRQRATTPPAFEPMMATLVERPFDHPGWVFEPKFDGLRVLVRCDGRAVTLVSRNGKPQEALFPEVADALRAGLRRPAVADGEIVCFDDRGRTSFRALQQRFHLKDPGEIQARGERYPAFIYLFDLLWLDGRDLTGEPLSERKRLLRKSVKWSDRVRWTESREGEGKALFREACRNGDEGVIGKLAAGRYVAGRSPAWVKVKCLGRQEFVVAGFTDPQRSRVGLGALLVGYYDGDRLRYAGKVGTGYTRETLLDLRRRLERLEQAKSPFAAGDPPDGPGVHWVRPELVAEIGFGEWTQNGLLRQPRFEGLRTDKSPRECRRERPKSTGDDISEAEATMPATKRSPGSALKEYRAKRNFQETPEPGPEGGQPHRRPIFVVQEHHATRLHYDFRLESGGVLKSWAVTREPSLDPAVKRLAVRVEDHPLGYAEFSGTIPAGHYGAGEVSIWDHGTYESADPGRTFDEGLETGRLSFVLHGEKLNGRFALIRMRGQGRGKENWLLIKSRDEHAEPGTAEAKPPARARKRAPAKAHVAGNGQPPRAVEVSHPEKVLFPDAGITKADVAAYYRKVAPRLLPYLKDRPVTLERLPDGLGAGKPHFWQKHTPTSYPDWIPRAELETERGEPVSYVLVNDAKTLLYLVNQGTLTFHPWLSRRDDLDRPDFVLFDLDPGTASFADAVAVAKRLHDELEDEGHKAFVKTSGKTGLHVLVPWRETGDFDAARAWAAGVAGRVAEAMPDRATAEIRKAKRHGRVYVDVMQNARGHHAVPPYVVRAVPAATVSTPLRWEELRPDLDPGRFTLRTLPARLARQARDPMAGLLRGNRG